MRRVVRKAWFKRFGTAGVGFYPATWQGWLIAVATPFIFKYGAEAPQPLQGAIAAVAILSFTILFWSTSDLFDYYQ
jgi:hypothetical protein